MSNQHGSTRRAHLALAGQNSGVGWLANLLLELDIPVVPPGSSDIPAWQDTGDGWSLTPYALRRLRGVLPAVHRRTVFPFHDDLEVCIDSDDLSALGNTDGPTIVVLRDPRDAFAGQWERGETRTASWDDFLAHAGGSPFALPPPETWAVRTLLWEALAKVRPVLIVRYENLRADTTREMARVLDFLGVVREGTEIAQAVALSTFERTQATLAQAAGASGAVAVLSRTRQEWRLARASALGPAGALWRAGRGRHCSRRAIPPGSGAGRHPAGLPR